MECSKLFIEMSLGEFCFKCLRVLRAIDRSNSMQHQNFRSGKNTQFTVRKASPGTTHLQEVGMLRLTVIYQKKVVCDLAMLVKRSISECRLSQMIFFAQVLSSHIPFSEIKFLYRNVLSFKWRGQGLLLT